MSESGIPRSPFEHRCPTPVRYRSPHVQVLYGPLLDERWHHWLLRVYRYASAKDVADGEAQAVGDLMHETLFVIHFCPFCGAKLSPDGT